MLNPFSLFELPVQFSVDTTLLSERYLSLQKSLHPDNFVAHSAQEQRLAMQKSAEINDALQVLKNPILRAEAIIQYYTNAEQDVEQKSTNDVTFLMQQMEWREKLEEIEAEKNEDELSAFTSEIENIQQSILMQLEKELNEQQWAQASLTTDKLRFIKKLMVEIEQVEEKLFDY
ncbi:Fe-S protein assembly co-chaperone HscB [Otariodibacter oris]|uniref:Co-chaperone protein HscB homolog n=1 Tax=Otariodibacter oris TaxID=1032623 RepID=A0A420XJU5_9PAST|nr:Fe-S protein assembly co-chaperone HscB [Otariodibacter oris]QGM80437.1 Fe-S protein assembly co-chaperone HscB [Otariodibacter oris]RKR77418.1 co-chaperone protein HscB [Otariodibacter oris]